MTLTHANKSNPNLEYLRRVYEDLLFLSSKYRRTHLGAAEFYAAPDPQRVSHFNAKIEPLLKKLGYPSPGGSDPKYLTFTDEVKRMWRST